jgi:hypothetical protein
MTQREDGPSTFLPSKFDDTFGGPIQAGNDVEQGRLAATRTTDDGESFAAPRLKLQIGKSWIASRTVAITQPMNVDFDSSD